MITFEDVDTVLKEKSTICLSNEYNDRQLRERNRNNERAKFLLKKLFPPIPIPENVDPTDFLIEMISLQVESAPTEKSFFKAILERFNFGFSYELYCSLRVIDLFLTQDINRACFESFWHAFFTLYQFNKHGEKCFMSFTNGDSCELKDAMNQLGIFAFPQERRDNCHQMTRMGLLTFPYLTGAYYYIPYQFEGALEHSVLIDQEQGMVYDLANNIALPLAIWESYYKEPSFLISGEEFEDLYMRVREKYRANISISTLEGVKRTLEKKKS